MRTDTGLIIARQVINARIDDVFTAEEIVAYVKLYYRPYEVFSYDELRDWAYDEGLAEVVE